ncbi:MAG TPA: gliding motility-associated C-terminal domain-containing protein [Chitinophagaceae bacterium]|nr:gliding motility-associated C-terminal domain-containing protein [Chitinophagaceae bacterium]
MGLPETKTSHSLFKKVLFMLLSASCSSILHAQTCPSNIDFEKGNFDGWTCYTGSVAAAGTDNVISLLPSGGPVYDQHTMFSATADAGIMDYYGNFPVTCPNGSGYSVKLGNTSGEARAEGLSYEFTIPANRNTYSLIYHYAVVFQDPSHQPYQQPRLVLEVWNVTDNELIDCSSFTFFPNGSPLPGFFMSPRSDSTSVWCKDWSAVSINLNEKAGKTIKLFFKTADCTFRRHFGYAYIDVNTECNSEFTGATYCPDDTAVYVTAPFGYQDYTWYNSTFTQVLGNQQIIHLSPPPPPGSILAVELIPFDGYGCKDTLYANMIDSLKLKADAGLDAISCNRSRVSIGANPVPGVLYNWYPFYGLTNPNIANPRASPDVTTEYLLTIRSTGGGCINTDTVIVTASGVDSSLQLDGNPLFCITSGDSAVLKVQPESNIQWFLNGNMIPGAVQNLYKVNQSGMYRAVITNSDGCSASTRTEQIEIETPRPGIHYPLQYVIKNIPVTLQARTFGASVLWKPSLWLDNPANVSPTFMASMELEQMYTIEITTTSGCLTSDKQLIKVINEVKVYVPTAFTPNNDGLNDYLMPVMLGIKELQYFKIFHRNGQLVYDISKGNELGWNGKIGGELQPTGVYVWMFRGLGWDKRIYTQKGTIALIR